MTIKKQQRDQTSQYLKAAGTMRVVSLADLKIDPAYQREERAHAEKIAREFDSAACDPLLVAERADGSLWDVDGQQRRRALMSLGITHWMAKVVKSSGTEFEARLFSIKGGATGTVKNLLQYEVFKAQLAHKDPVALAVQRAVEGAGFKLSLSNHRGWPWIGAFKMLQRNVKTQGEENLLKALQMIAKAWPGQNNSVSGHVIDGVCAVVYRPETDLEWLVQVMSSVSVNLIYQAGVDNGAGTGTLSRRAKVFAAIATRYNKGLKARSKRIPIKVKVVGVRGEEDEAA